ncbi:hypothetical protein NP493_47g02026 [Ridgeia piscesae]|uniref:CDP-diacylglycerol--inositol 3-phosphatidyltransferase n=1 Tax=Ridgeia piscesae TaxID=27915 RepID=A0AAD9PBK9_RIDPI|nr:hypothetical protein NP493_47g02026 [Ridgeia piscesae]
MPTSYGLAVFFYLTSGLLDAFDGHAARMLNQSSRFGAMLDMLTDRCATMCLQVVLAHFYPTYMFFFQVVMAIDITSHWIHVQSSLMSGSNSHKRIDLAGNPVLRYYYTDRAVLFSVCAGNELFYAALYLRHFTDFIVPLGSLSFGLCSLLCWVCAPVAIAKVLINLVQLYAACQNVVAVDDAERAAGKTE